MFVFLFDFSNTFLKKRERERAGSAVFNNVKMAELSNDTKFHSGTLCTCSEPHPLSRAMEWTQAQTGIHSSIQILIYTDTRCDAYTSGGNPGFQGSKGEVREREWLSHTRTPSRFHTPTHSRPKIRSQVRGNCTQERVVTTRKQTHEEKRLWKLESNMSRTIIQQWEDLSPGLKWHRNTTAA